MKVLVLILAMKTSLVLGQDINGCDLFEEIEMSVFISGFSKTDSIIRFSKIAKGFKIIPIDTAYQVVQFYVGYGCEFIEHLVKGQSTSRQRWISNIKSDNIFSIHCILVQHGDRLYRAKSRIYFLRGHQPCE